MCCFAKRVGGGGGSIIEGGFGILPWLAVAGSTCWHWRPGRRSRLAGRGRQLDGGWSVRMVTGRVGIRWNICAFKIKTRIRN